VKSDEAFERLVQAWREDRLAQAYIVDSPDIDGALALVGRFLQVAHCESESGPCGECASCRQVEEGRHPDAIRIEPQKKSRIISVDQVRELQRLIYMTSFAGGWKSCVLVCADRLGQQASNAFLKTLEEPPPRSVFFLATDSPQALLPTILSRCQRIVLSESAAAMTGSLRERITEILADDSPGGLVGGLAKGDQLVALLKELKESVAEREHEAMDEEAGEREKDVLEARIDARYKAVRTAVMRVVESWYRDVLLVSCGVREGLANPDHLAAVQGQAEKGGYRVAMQSLQRVEQMSRRFERNMQEAQVLGLGFCRLGW